MKARTGDLAIPATTRKSSGERATTGWQCKPLDIVNWARASLRHLGFASFAPRLTSCARPSLASLSWPRPRPSALLPCLGLGCLSKPSCQHCRQQWRSNLDCVAKVRLWVCRKFLLAVVAIEAWLSLFVSFPQLKSRDY